MCAGPAEHKITLGEVITEHLPTHCPNGHKLLPGRAIIGWYPCRCAGTSGHRTQLCLECDVTRYLPPHAGGKETAVGYPSR